MTARGIGPLGVQGDICIDSQRAACCVPRAARTADRPSVENFPRRRMKATLGERIIGVNIVDFVHRSRAAIRVKGNTVAEFFVRHRANDPGVQIVICKGDAIGASVDSDGHIVQVGKRTAFLRIEVNSYCIRLTRFDLVVYITEHISVLAPVLEPFDGSNLIISCPRRWLKVQRVTDHGHIEGQLHLGNLLRCQCRCRQQANQHHEAQQKAEHSRFHFHIHKFILLFGFFSQARFISQAPDIRHPGSRFILPF